LEAFYSFLGTSLQKGEKEWTPEAVLRRWRAERETEETCAEIRAAIADMEAGLGIPVEEAFAKLRRKHGIVDP
jgi:hypothetical protein